MEVLWDIFKANAGSAVVVALLVYIWKNHLAHIQASLARLEHGLEEQAKRFDDHIMWHLNRDDDCR